MIDNYNTVKEDKVEKIGYAKRMAMGYLRSNGMGQYAATTSANKPSSQLKTNN
jgi:hypothetical protein